MGWAIIGAWYRIETFQMEVIKDQKVTTNGTVNLDTSITTISPRSYNQFVNYFVSVTPNLFEDFLLGIEYQGGFSIIHQEFDNNANTDTTNTTYFNDIIIAMEKLHQCTRPWCDVLTVRGSLRYTFGWTVNRFDFTDGDYEEEVSPLSTKDGVEGMQLFFGIGYNKARVTVDFGMQMMEWNNTGIIAGPYPAAVSMTVDLYKGD